MTSEVPTDPTPAWLARVCAGLVFAIVLTACNDDGRTLAPAPTTSAPTVTEPDGQAVAPFAVRVQGVSEDGTIGSVHTCDGDDTAPTVDVDGIPPGTVEIAITVTDLDAEGFVHWIAAGLPPENGAFRDGALPIGAVTAGNDFGTQGWAGPCPPPGSGAHRYEFRVHAMLEPIGLAPDLSASDALAIVRAATVEDAATVVRYTRAEPE